MSFDAFASNYKFYDDRNFPYGFQRSGDFTFQESENLTRYGYTMLQLAEEKIQPEGDDHEHFIKVLSGQTDPANDAEKVFIKYLILINKKNTYIRAFSTSVDVDEDDADNDDDDIVVEADDDSDNDLN
jgi:uncharacterized protein YifE (UPF0438 family)